MKKQFFYQDFIFNDIPLDKAEYPDVKLSYITTVANYKKFDLSYDQKGEDVRVYLKDLTEMLDPEDWKRFLNHVQQCNKIAIIDNVPIVNEELQPYKIFYLKAYYSIISRHCKHCDCSNVTM